MATLAFAAPFALYVGLLALGHYIPLPVTALHAFRLVVVAAVIALVSRRYLSLRPTHPLASIGVGVAVLVIWIGPDLLFAYRHFWLFENALTGRAETGVPASLKQDPFFLSVRLLTTAALVPMLEELFWRGWLMRWLIDRNFLKVPLGTYQPFAFWVVAALFASEHGPFWEVGLAAGIIYNWWLIRTKNLADCVLAHATTNLVLALYVLVSNRWEYWL